MLGWVIYKQNRGELKPEMYEVQRLTEVAATQGIQLAIYRPDQFDLVVTREDRKSIQLDGEPTPLPDFVLPRMGAGTTYFALAVIRHLERLGVKCFNTSGAIDTVKDKLFTHQILAENNIPVPKTMLVKFPLNVELVRSQIGFPAVVKTLSGSQGKGVFLSPTEDHFNDLMQLIEVTNPTANIIIQEFVESSYGRDVRVLTIGGRAVAAMERYTEDETFKANYSSGGKVRSIEITPEIEWMASEASRLLGLDIAGVDLLYDGDHFKVCEVNSSPGFEGLESCTGVNVASEIYHFLKIRLGLFPKLARTIDIAEARKADTSA